MRRRVYRQYRYSQSPQRPAIETIEPRILFSTFGPAAKLVFIVQPIDAVAGTSSSSIVIDVQDANGNLVTDDNSLITVSLVGGPVSGVATSNAVNGVATFSERLFNLAGTYRLDASDTDNGVTLSPSTSNLFTITPGPETQIVITNSPTIMPGNPTDVTADLEDQFGNITTYDNASALTLSINGPTGFGLTGAPQTVTATAGVGMFQLALSVPGTYSFTATGNNFTNSYSPNALVYTAPQLSFADYIGTTTAGKKLAPLSIALYNSSGLVNSKKTKVTLTMFSSPAGGKILGHLHTKPKNGIATFKGLSFKKAGAYQLGANATGFGSALSTTFTVIPAAPKKIIFVQQPSPNPVAEASGFSTEVSVLDRYKNVINGATVALTLKSGAKGATPLTGVLSESTINGDADFTNLTLGVAGDYALLATDGKLKATSKKLAVS